MQSTRMIKVGCPEWKCGVVARMSAKHIAAGLPTCHCGLRWVVNPKPKPKDWRPPPRPLIEVLADEGEDEELTLAPPAISFKRKGAP
jgi:hypothetical protein